MNLKLKIRVQNCRNIEKKCDAIFENVIENIMNINVVMILYVIGIIICDLIYHLKELYVIYASEIIVRSIVYIVCKTVITVEFPNAKYRRKQIKVHLNLPVEKMGHLYRVIKQHVIGIKCRNSLPLRTQDNYKHKNMGGKTAMYPWKSYVILLYEILIYLRNIIFQVRIMLSICWTTKPFHNFKSKCINEIPLFIVISYQQIKEMIYTRVQMKTLHRESTYKDFIQKNEMFLPYVIRKSSIVLVPVHNFSNLLFVIFIKHTYIIYIHKHRIVYKNKSVNPNIYIVVKSMVIKCININTHVAESSPTSWYKVNYYKYRNKNMEWNVRRICNVYSNIVNINVKNEMYLCEIFLIMYKKENCVCKGLTFLFICVVVKLFFIKFINITRVVESSFKSGYKVNYYNNRNQYMVCNVRRICNIYIVNMKVRIKTYLCPKFVIMCKYENCVCKYLTFLFRCEILFENNLIILLYDNVQQYN